MATPARAGAAYPAIPEPMIFDMMRPLCAAKGELEINALAQTVSPFRPRSAEWAPELEYAYADGHAIEFELPFDGARLAALKIGLQSSLGVSGDGRTAHGIQYLGIHDRDARHYSSSLLYLLGHRYSSRWSSMTMLGVDRISLDGGSGRNALLFNHAAFYDANADTVLGAELNMAGGADRSLKVSPQIHRRLSAAINVQIAAGFEKQRHEALRPTAGLRLVRQF
ncbi:MAG: hypothetical protein DI605_05360 [Sphingomonas sp.]|nr:MAG: hypothetical protein DI605_05360 [Sphingomonas sp.]